VGIPESQIALFQFAEAEIPPENKLVGKIRLGRGKDHVPGGKNDVYEHEDNQDKEYN
jgi:hypothetical protein